MMVGVWECTQGSFKLTYTFNELATVLEGRITIAFPDGSSHDFGPGEVVIPAHQRHLGVFYGSQVPAHAIDQE